jgi:hypothetical protein
MRGGGRVVAGRDDDASGLANGAVDYPAVRARVLDESLAASAVLLVGDAPAAKELTAADPDRFALDGVGFGQARPDQVEVLALSLDPEVLERARTVAAEHGRDVLHALVEPAAGEVDPVAALRGELRTRGLLLVGLRRIFWPAGQERGRRSRARQLDEETRELLVRLVADGSSGSSALLEDELARLERELAVAGELRVEQQMARAATEQRLQESTATGRRLEADRRRLEQEASLLRAELARVTGELQDARQELAEAATERRRRRWSRLRRIVGR